MLVGIVKVKIYISFAQSLKEKRAIVKSICSKVRNKFNVSIAEVEDQDIHKNIVIGISLVSNNKRIIDSQIDKILNYIETLVPGDIINVEREII